MYEMLALAAGVGLGLTVVQVPQRFRWLLCVVGAMAIGVSVAALSGELAESWAFALFDTVQAAVAAGLTVYLVIAWRKRRTST
jgi:uncharacterized membrane protein